MRRLREVVRQILISVDQLAQVLIVGVAYLLHLTSTGPSADETISSYVGRGMIRGEPWAMMAAAVIDPLFQLLGDEPWHCLRNVEAAFLGTAPTL